MVEQITPGEVRQRMETEGEADFEFEFGDAGRFRTSIFDDTGTRCLLLSWFPAET